jgi:Rrf2 family iron-sulfur cluster assembly transcriptional regulator
MRLTTRGKLAVTAITDVALHSHGRPVALPGISVRQGISLSYLEDIFSALRRVGLVHSVRGPGGGYMLTRPPQSLSVAEIVMASEKYMAHANDKASDATTRPSPDDMTADLWASFHSRIMEYLQSITVADLLAQQGTGVDNAGSPAAMARLSQARPHRARETQLPSRDVPNSVFALGLRTG